MDERVIVSKSPHVKVPVDEKPTLTWVLCEMETSVVLEPLYIWGLCVTAYYPVLISPKPACYQLSGSPLLCSAEIAFQLLYKVVLPIEASKCDPKVWLFPKSSDLE